MSKAKAKWYWHGRKHAPGLNAQWGWVHSGKCVFALRLEGREAEPELNPDKWEPITCIVCGGENE